MLLFRSILLSPDELTPSSVSSSYGASGVWVGTRFVASVEAGAPKMHKDLVVSAGYDDVVRTLIFSGRPMSVRKTPYVAEWSVFASSFACFFTSFFPLLS